MRTFCTEGPVDPERNYYVPREDMVDLGLQKVDDWRYFTLFAPRQAGKSTYYDFLLRRIQTCRPEYLGIWLTFEAFGQKTETTLLPAILRQIYLRLGHRDDDLGIPRPKDIEELSDFFVRLSEYCQKDLVLIIDEIEGLSNLHALNLFLHSVRSIYHDRRQHRLRSVILVGVSNITGILQDSASPFNIADQINIPYFTFEETRDLLEQHTRETGQVFLPEVIRGIYDNTVGQPGLVNALARDLVETRCSGMTEIGMTAFYQTLDAFLRVYIDKNISNVVNKARQYPEVMKQILFDGPVNFYAYDERLSFLRVNGAIVDQDGQCAVPVPIYKKCLYQTFKPLTNGNEEIRHFKDPLISITNFLLPDGSLDMEKLLNRYAEYVRERGNIVFSGGKAQEGVYHYNLDAYLSSFLDFLGGRVFPEVPEGGGRVDLLVLQGHQRWIVEVKRFDGPDKLERGKRQLSAYLLRSMLTVGYLVVFSDVHKSGSQGREVVDGQDVLWWILPVSAEVPSRVS